MTTDHARQQFLAPQLSEIELTRLLIFTHRRLSTCEKCHQWRAALSLCNRERTLLELLMKRSEEK